MKSFKQVYTSLTLLLLPIIYGCTPSGGSDSSMSSFLFGSGSTASTEAPTVAQTAVNSVSATDVAMITNPEPATMLLMGGGMVAMAYMKARKKNLK